MAKAYDRVNWSFLSSMLKGFSFRGGTHDLIMSCVMTASFSVIVNGISRDLFKAERGIRQGCPLSPYLFILCSELLSRLFYCYERDSPYKGIKVNRYAPPVSHLMFADDLFIFGSANAETLTHLKELLGTYANWSGQCINFQKSSIHFSTMVTQETKLSFADGLEVKDMEVHDKYLGNFLLLPKHLCSSYYHLIDKCSKKMAGWKSNVLSHAGRTVLLKSTLSSVPIYFLSANLVPDTIIDKLVQIQRAFWWGHGVDERHSHYINWKTIISPKALGGLGVRDLGIMNEALVGKLAWRFLNEPNSLWVRLLTARYGRRDQFWITQKKNNDSAIWRAILKGRDWIAKGTLWSIGWMSTVNIWDDPWVPDLPNFRVQGTIGARSKALLVYELIDHHCRAWRMELLAELFTPTERQAIMRIHIPSVDDRDTLIWNKTKEGTFSTKSLYHSMVQELPSSSRNLQLNMKWSKFWNCKRISPRVLTFIWRLLHNGLPVGSKMGRFLDRSDTLCHLCNESVEDCDHLLLRCDFARSVWFASPLSLRTSVLDLGLAELIWSWVDNWSEDQLGLAYNIMWSIWKARCCLIYDKKVALVGQVVAAAVKGHEDYIAPSNSEILTTQEVENPIRLPSWLPPPSGVVKFNVDGAVREAMAAAGVVGRNSNGEVVWCSSKIYQFGSFQMGSADLAEAEAMLLSMQIAMSLNLQNIIIESDSLNVVNAVNGQPNSCAWRALSIAREISRLKANLLSCEITKVHRNISICAHELANYAVNHPLEGDFSSPTVHPCIVSLLEHSQSM